MKTNFSFGIWNCTSRTPKYMVKTLHFVVSSKDFTYRKMKTVWKRWPVGLSRESDNLVAGVSRPDCISFMKSSPGKPCDGVAWSVRTPWRRDRQVRSDWSFRSSATRRKDENNRSVLIHSVARPLPTSHSINTSPVTPHSRSSGALFWAAISTQLTSQVSV